MNRPVIPVNAGIQKLTRFASWTPAFAGVTISNIITPDQ